MKKFLACMAASTALFTGGLLAPVYAGTINLVVVEDKGTVTITDTEVTIVPTETVITECDITVVMGPMFFECGIKLSQTILPNLEIYASTTTTTIDLFNIYAASIEIPQPALFQQLIDIYWFTAADLGSGIGSLPTEVSLTGGSLTGNLSGTQYPIQITPINDLANLPTSSSNDTQIVWDLSALSGTTGNFFLAKATLPVEEICAGPSCSFNKVPEPTSTLSLLALGTLGAASTLKRKLKSSQSTEKETTKVG